MYCKNCSYELKGMEKYCPNCGKKVNYQLDDNALTIKDESPKSLDQARTTSITLGIISMIGIFFGILAPISFVLSLIGLFLAIKVSRKVSNPAGIILNAISLFISTIMTIFIAIVFYLIVTGVDTIPNLIDEYLPHNETYGEIDKF